MTDIHLGDLVEILDLGDCGIVDEIINDDFGEPNMLVVFLGDGVAEPWASVPIEKAFRIEAA